MAKNTQSRRPEIQKQTENPTPQRARVVQAQPSKPFLQREDELVFGKSNFIWMGVGAALILAGLLLMLGGEQPDPNQWDPNIIYSTRIISIAPMVMIAGVIVEIYAIFKD
jgi:hypothetical protein